MMGFIRLSLDSPVTFVNIPGIFIDKYMTEANGEFVKVYLYLLYCMNQDSQGCSVSAIADHFNHTENDILRALRYWEKAGVLKLSWSESGDLEHISFLDLGSTSNGTTKPAPTVAVTSTIAPADSTPAKKEYSLNELQAFGNDPDVAELLFITEQYLRRTLNPSEMGTIIYWMDSLKMSRNLAEYLIEYCVGGGHTSLHYMDKVALGWAKDGITSVEDAKAHVTGRSKACFGVMKALGITSRSLVE
ncbi:MAG: DnaD domain protein, partial [Agathobacter sp.]|nr:DnaD domain protein [Agathobacter sp.]